MLVWRPPSYFCWYVQTCFNVVVLRAIYMSVSYMMMMITYVHIISEVSSFGVFQRKWTILSFFFFSSFASGKWSHIVLYFCQIWSPMRMTCIGALFPWRCSLNLWTSGVERNIGFLCKRYVPPRLQGFNFGYLPSPGVSLCIERAKLFPIVTYKEFLICQLFLLGILNGSFSWCLLYPPHGYHTVP